MLTHTQLLRNGGYIMLECKKCTNKPFIEIKRDSNIAEAMKPIDGNKSEPIVSANKVYDEEIYITEEILNFQHHECNLLQQRNRLKKREKPLLIKLVEGSAQGLENPADAKWMYYKDVIKNAISPVYTRGITPLEIVIDCDIEDYQSQKTAIKKIISVLKKDNAPYYLFWSGGKGFHLHIFLYDKMNILQQYWDQAKELDFDITRIVRVAVTQQILKNAKVDPEDIGLDWRKINFNTYSKGSQIRITGATRANGRWKTLLDEIPENKPDILPLKFVEAYDTWNIKDTDYNQAINSALKNEIDRVKKSNEFNLENIKLNAEKIGDFPCMQKLSVTKVKPGSRYHALYGIKCLAADYGYKKEEAEETLFKIGSGFDLTPAELQSRVDSALNDWGSGRHFSCRVFKELFGQEICDFSNCPIRKKISSHSVDKILEDIDKSNIPTRSVEKNEFIWKLIEKAITRLNLDEITALLNNEIKIRYGLKKPEIDQLIKKFKKSVQKNEAEKYFNETGTFIPLILSQEIQTHYHIITTADSNGKNYNIWIYDTDNGFYKPNGALFIQQYAQKALGKRSSKKRIEEVEYHVSIDTLKESSVFDVDPSLVNFKNVYLNISTGEVYEHTADVPFNYVLPVNYDAQATCDKFDAYLDKIEVNKTLIYEIFAYCLVPRYPLQYFFNFIGDGGNGKGTIGRCLTAFIGEENATHHDMNSFASNRYAVGDLYGKRLNWCGDISKDIVKSTNLLKTLTGGDPVTGPVIYSGNISFYNSAKLIFSQNHVPYYDDDTDSIYRRFVYVMFNKRVTDFLDNDIFDEEALRTTDELSGILNKCLEVLPALMKRGNFSAQMTIEETREFVYRKSNPVEVFYEECLMPSNYAVVPTDDVYKTYKIWCERNNTTPLNQTHFGRKLRIINSEIGKIYRTHSELNKQVYHYTGIKLNDEYANLIANIPVNNNNEKYVSKMPLKNKENESIDNVNATKLLNNNKLIEIEEEKNIVNNIEGNNDILSVSGINSSNSSFLEKQVKYVSDINDSNSHDIEYTNLKFSGIFSPGIIRTYEYWCQYWEKDNNTKINSLNWERALEYIYTNHPNEKRDDLKYFILKRADIDLCSQEALT